MHPLALMKGGVHCLKDCDVSWLFRKVCHEGLPRVRSVKGDRSIVESRRIDDRLGRALFWPAADATFAPRCSENILFFSTLCRSMHLSSFDTQIGWEIRKIALIREKNIFHPPTSSCFLAFFKIFCLSDRRCGGVRLVAEVAPLFFF